jgi:hypothetical protein
MGGGGTRSQQQQGLWAAAVFRNPPYVGTWDDRERIKPVKNQTGPGRGERRASEKGASWLTRVPNIIEYPRYYIIYLYIYIYIE